MPVSAARFCFLVLFLQFFSVLVEVSSLLLISVNACKACALPLFTVAYMARL